MKKRKTDVYFADEVPVKSYPKPVNFGCFHDKNRTALRVESFQKSLMGGNMIN